MQNKKDYILLGFFVLLLIILVFIGIIVSNNIKSKDSKELNELLTKIDNTKEIVIQDLLASNETKFIIPKSDGEDIISILKTLKIRVGNPIESSNRRFSISLKDKDDNDIFVIYYPTLNIKDLDKKLMVDNEIKLAQILLEKYSISFKEITPSFLSNLDKVTKIVNNTSSKEIKDTKVIKNIIEEILNRKVTTYNVSLTKEVSNLSFYSEDELLYTLTIYDNNLGILTNATASYKLVNLDLEQYLK